MKRTSKNYLSYAQEKYAIEEYKEYLIEAKGVKQLSASLLDSSLITPTRLKTYYFKIIDCGNYKQVYFFNKLKVKNDKNLEKSIDNCMIFKTENLKRKNDLKFIEYKNILRSKINLQRLVKCNENIFKTFITLTFADNISDVDIANKKFRYWVDSVRRIYKDFAYICVPEFQKRGAVHYHLLTNLDIKKNKDIILKQENKKNMYDVRFWNNGFTSVFPMKNMNVVGYISKYMTKDIDNRLFGRRRYLYTQNLITPKEYIIDYNNEKELKQILNIINNGEIKYKKQYLDYYGDEINFVEYKMKDNIIDTLFGDFVTYKKKLT